MFGSDFRESVERDGCGTKPDFDLLQEVIKRINNKSIKRFHTPQGIKTDMVWELKVAVDKYLSE